MVGRGSSANNCAHVRYRPMDKTSQEVSIVTHARKIALYPLHAYVPQVDKKGWLMNFVSCSPAQVPFDNGWCENRKRKAKGMEHCVRKLSTRFPPLSVREVSTTCRMVFQEVRITVSDLQRLRLCISLSTIRQHPLSRAPIHFSSLSLHSQPYLTVLYRVSYTRSVSVSSIVGYVVGLGDRHSSNILIGAENT